MDFADTNKDGGVSLNEFCALVKTINELAASTTSTLTTSYSNIHTQSPYYHLNSNQKSKKNTLDNTINNKRKDSTDNFDNSHSNAKSSSKLLRHY